MIASGQGASFVQIARGALESAGHMRAEPQGTLQLGGQSTVTGVLETLAPHGAEIVGGNLTAVNGTIVPGVWQFDLGSVLKPPMAVSYYANMTASDLDAIVAYLSSGRGVVIHRENCSNVAAFGKQPDKWIPAVWQKDQQRLFAEEP